MGLKVLGAAGFVLLVLVVLAFVKRRAGLDVPDAIAGKVDGLFTPGATAPPITTTTEGGA